MSCPTYLVYRVADADGGGAVEMGRCEAVPSKGDKVFLDDVPYQVHFVTWRVYSRPSSGEDPPRMEYPQQCAEALLRRW